MNIFASLFVSHTHDSDSSSNKRGGFGGANKQSGGTPSFGGG